MNTEIGENLTVATSYYGAMLKKDFVAMAGYLAEDVCFVSPFAKIDGKEAVLNAAKNFGETLQDIQIRAKFTKGNQAMLAYDMQLPAPVGQFRAAVLMDFGNSQITKIELFFDSAPFNEN